MLRRPSVFMRPSILISKQDLPAKGKRNDEETISQDESSRSRKLKPSSRSKKSDLSTSGLSRSVSLWEVQKQPMIEQIKKDILDYLDNIIESAESLVLLRNLIKKLNIAVIIYF